MSRFHYIRVFQQIYGVTPRQYLRDVRIAKAKKLLKKGGPVTRVCLEVGYESLPTFSNAFKRATGYAPSIKFKGVETNRPYGEYWIASDFDCEHQGHTTKVHSIVGYDLDKKKLVGTVIDHGPYAAGMTGEYDEQSKTVQWKPQAKGLDGKPMIQKTLISQMSADERVLIMTVPGKQKDKITKFMEIRFVRRK